MKFAVRAVVVLAALLSVAFMTTPAFAASERAYHGADYGQILDYSSFYPNKIVIACDMENDNRAVWAQYHRVTSTGGSVYDYVADPIQDGRCTSVSWHGTIWRVRAVRMCEEVPGAGMFASCGTWKYAT